MSSGIRSTFCYAPTTRVQQWDPQLTLNPDILPSWAVDQAQELIKNGPYGNGRVSVGLAFDALFLPKETVTDLYQKCRRAGAKVFTTHYVRGAIFGITANPLLPHSLIPIPILHHHLIIDPNQLTIYTQNKKQKANTPSSTCSKTTPS
jgi:hypothetical protein